MIIYKGVGGRGRYGSGCMGSFDRNNVFEWYVRDVRGGCGIKEEDGGRNDLCK